ncbi:ABC transporter ATP-binding protein [Hyphomicrobium sp. CS1BSMeth3]|uniref:ABC transporter ATP-binding protein n=1 Tax=Hyphomicrobium sp. CS1BSMeth3 TaxID=1892844 RepID=UPI000930C9DA|nr:ABC transporter ATP-binding protein [Hyphomicrobium sp. CS1BSMeth3]
MSDRILTVEGLEVSLPVPSGTLNAVHGVSFHVDRGETVCIVGESGCGKSLTALSIMDLLPKRARRAARELTLLGEPIVGVSETTMADLRGNRMAMIFQEPMTSLNPAYTIGNQLEEALLRHRKVPRAKARERAIHLLERVGITAAEQRLRQYPHQLSGGLRQRVMIAMALMTGPDLIIADEPTTALDVTIQAQILHLLAELQREFHMGLVLITHDLGVVARIATRVVVMYAGQVVETGTAAEVFGAPRHPYTRGLLDCIPIPGKTKRGERLGTIPGMVPSLVGQIQGCHFAGRCNYVIDECRAAPIPLEATPDGGHEVRCIRADELMRGGFQPAESVA